jgi:hypothetical protein
MLAALLTFAVGCLAAAVGPLHVFVLFCALILSVPLMIVGLVVHEGAVHGREWRPLVGKGVLSILLWGALSPLTLLVQAAFYLTDADWDAPLASPATEPPVSLFALVSLAVLTAIYGLLGAGLCLWVRAREGRGPTIWENTRWGASR